MLFRSSQVMKEYREGESVLTTIPPRLPPPSSPRQSPPSPDPDSRRSPYHRHSYDSLDYLAGLMPKALSPTPYAPLERGIATGMGTGRGGAGMDAGGVVCGLPSPSASPVTVSALSHYSSSTAGLLEELQICGLDSPGASPTPSPTLSHASTAGTEEALTSAAVTNVTIHSSPLRPAHGTNIHTFTLPPRHPSASRLGGLRLVHTHTHTQDRKSVV